jgi:hypothetical protein
MLNNVGLELSPCFTPRVVKNGSLYELSNLHEYKNVQLVYKTVLMPWTTNARSVGST